MNPYQKGNQAYKQAAVRTDDQGTLILMMYDGAIRFLKVAIMKLEQRDLEPAHSAIIKAKDIVSELIASLNLEDSGEVGKNLNQLYVFMYNHLIDANVQKNAKLVQEVLDLFLELREGWREAVKAKKAADQTGGGARKPGKTTLTVTG